MIKSLLLSCETPQGGEIITNRTLTQHVLRGRKFEIEISPLSVLSKIESLKAFMEMNLSIYYFHLQSKSFLPIDPKTFN